MEKLELHGDTNDPEFLREELKRNSFLLAHEKLDNNKRQEKIQHLLDSNKEKLVEIQAIKDQMKALNDKLHQAESRLYDIGSDSDFDSDEVENEEKTQKMIAQPSGN